MTSQSSNWNYPTSIRFGPGRIRELPDACRELNIERPLLVTDPGIAGLPILTAALEANQLQGIRTGVFSEVQGNPVGENVEQGVDLFRTGNHDGVIAMGGDQLGDFSDLFNAGQAVSARRGATMTLPIAGMWGNGWFVMLNPVYGSGLKGGFDDVFPMDKRWAPPAKGEQ